MAGRRPGLSTGEPAAGSAGRTSPHTDVTAAATATAAGDIATAGWSAAGGTGADVGGGNERDPADVGRSGRA
jgi:hypothetical protein